MNLIATVVLTASALGILFSSRQLALLPFMLGACFLTNGQGVDIVGLHFTPVRILTAVGIGRWLCSGRRLPSGPVGLDYLVVLWGIWACVSSGFHYQPISDFIYKLGIVWDVLGTYIVARVYIVSLNQLFLTTIIVLVPIGFAMLSERMVGNNPFTALGGVPAHSHVRDGHIRSRGSFRHAILAGTVGALLLPLAVAYWRRKRGISMLGGLTSLVMIATSGSSGPVMTAIAGVFSVLLWPYRRHVSTLRWSAFTAYLLLEVVMERPAYFIIQRLDVTGSSTGWHRAALIQASLAHLDEWWLAGTDHTRHWMPTGVSFSTEHTDITNHYIQIGVHGGLPLVILFDLLLITAFVYVARVVRREHKSRWSAPPDAWILGSLLFAHAISCISVAYFDQSEVFLYLTLGAIATLYSRPSKTARDSGRALGRCPELTCSPGAVLDSEELTGRSCLRPWKPALLPDDVSTKLLE